MLQGDFRTIDLGGAVVALEMLSQRARIPHLTLVHLLDNGGLELTLTELVGDKLHIELKDGKTKKIIATCNVEKRRRDSVIILPPPAVIEE